MQPPSRTTDTYGEGDRPIAPIAARATIQNAY